MYLYALERAIFFSQLCISSYTNTQFTFFKFSVAESRTIFKFHIVKFYERASCPFKITLDFNLREYIDVKINKD